MPRFILVLICLLFSCINNEATDLRCNPEDGRFLCQSKHACIHSVQVCDKRNDCADGSDEWADCEKSCMNATCEYGCTPNINADGRGICYCRSGYKVSELNGDGCVNRNECTEHWGACSQMCEDTIGSFKCSCMEGFHLLHNNSTCVPKESSRKLIFALKDSVGILDLVTSNVTIIVEKMGQTVGVTFDAAREYVYWTDVHVNLEAIYRSKLDGKNVEVIVDSGLNLAEGIAFDWIAGNIYFTDSNSTHIGVCDKDGKSCGILVKEYVDKPREIVLHPSTGKLYWTDWGEIPSVVLAGMDGSFPMPIINSGLSWPNGLAIDHGTSRLYWMDALRDFIESSSLEGSDRRVVRTQGIRHPFSLDVFGDTLYWSDWSSQEIQSCNKFTGEDHVIEFARPREQVNGVVVYHPAAQPKNRVNHCQNTTCSHICVLTPTQSYRCLCPSGMILESNKKTCKDDLTLAKLFIAKGSSLNQLPLDFIGRAILSERNISGLHTIGTITYNPINDTYVLFDTYRKKVLSYDHQAHKLATLVSRDLDAVKGIAIDAVGHNIYWVDAGKQTIEIQSLRNGARAEIQNFEDKPLDIIAVSEVKSVFVATVSPGRGGILRLSMDGSENHVLLRINDGEPTAITFHPGSEHIYWCDSVKGTIEHISISGGPSYVAVSKAGASFSIALYGNRIYWSGRYNLLSAPIVKTSQLSQDPTIFFGKLNRLNSTEEGNYSVTIGIMNRDLSNIQEMADAHECSPSRTIGTIRCSHICVISNQDNKAACMCPRGFQLDRQDERTCVPQSTCPSSQFKCKDGICLSMVYRCDGFRDCTSGEDEQDCTVGPSATNPIRKATLDKYWCLSGEYLDFKLVCDGRMDCLDGSDESEGCLDTCKSEMNCSYTCIRTPRGPRCSCPPGYRLTSNDSALCMDINECLEEVCDHYCINLKGGYKCSCHHEYILMEDHKTCKSKGSPPLFVFESNKSICVSQQDLLSFTQMEVHAGLSGFTVDSRSGNIYWTDALSGTIGRMNLDLKVSPEILITGLSTPTLIAYDWISSNGFIAASRSPGLQTSIWICSLTMSKSPLKRKCASLYPISGDNVTGIAVAPEQNFIFWTEILFRFNSYSGAIMRGELDGTRTVILAAEKVQNPRGLAVDLVFERVFWIDSQSKTIEVVNFDGKGRRTLISSGISNKISDGVALFENWVMWIDGERNIRCRTDMLADCTQVDIQNISDARYLSIYQSSLQPTGKDPCENNSCSFICTGSQEPGLESSSIRVPKCLCQQGFASDDSNNFYCTKMKPSFDESGNDVKNGNSDYLETILIVVFLVLIVPLTVAAIYFYKQKNSRPKIHVRPYVHQCSSPLL